MLVQVRDGDVVRLADALEHHLVALGVGGEAAGHPDEIHHGLAGEDFIRARVPNLARDLDGRAPRGDEDGLPLVQHRILGQVPEALQAHEVVRLDAAIRVQYLHAAPRTRRSDSARRQDDHVETKRRRNLHRPGAVHVAENVHHEGARQHELAVELAALVVGDGHLLEHGAELRDAESRGVHHARVGKQHVAAGQHAEIELRAR